MYICIAFCMYGRTHIPTPFKAFTSVCSFSLFFSTPNHPPSACHKWMVPFINTKIFFLNICLHNFSKGLCLCCKYMLFFVLRGILFYHRSPILVQFVLLLVMVSQFSQEWTFNFSIFACFMLRHCSTWCYCPVATEKVKILFMNFL